MKLSTLLLTIAILGCFTVATGQIQVSYNSPQKIGGNGFFSKEYRPAQYRVPIPDPGVIREKERLNEQSSDKQFLIAEPMPSDIDVVRSASWVENEGHSYGKFTIRADSAKTLSINFDRFFFA